jgi:ferritin
MPGKPIQTAVLNEIQRQINYELAAAHAYTALAIWCDEANYNGFAGFFKKQAGEERDHADKLVAHLIDRGARPDLGSLPAPKGGFESLMDVAKQAQAMEQANTVGIHLVYEAAVATKDYPAQVLLQWFISEQVEEEAWTDEMVDRVARAGCAGGLSELDRHIDRYMSGGS